MFKRCLPASLVLLALAWLLASSSAFAQGARFTFQGKLTDSGSPANGVYDMQFKLFNTGIVGTGTQQGPMINDPGVTVTAGIFTVQLDFGATVFAGADRYLEIGVRPAGSPDSYTTLAPRQQVTPTPYAMRSTTAATADYALNSSQLGGLPATGFIQNASTQQASTNFNISGNGTAAGSLSGNAVNATTQYNIGGNRVLSAVGTSNLFAGLNAGAANTGGLNSFFGGYAGSINLTGSDNAFFGAFAGANNTTGSSNSFFGRYAGLANTTGNNTTVFGSNAGLSNTTASDNTFIGASSNGAAGITNATAIGSRAAVSQTNSLVLGSISGVNGATASVNVGIGTTAPTARLHVVGDINTTTDYNIGGSRVLSTEGTGNLLVGVNTGTSNSGSYNSFFGFQAGISNTIGSNNTFIGAYSNLVGSVTNATAIGYRASVTQSNSLVLGSINGVNGATADTLVGIGTRSPLKKLHVAGGSSDGILGSSTSGTGVWGDSDNGTGVRGWSTSGVGVWGDSGSGTGVRGTSASGYAGEFSGKISVSGTIAVYTLGAAGATTLCRNASSQIATCSSSLRYKTDVRPFSGGLDLLNRLRPIAFAWKQDGMRDLGLAAEEVVRVEPLLVTHKASGEVEGVKYDRLNVVLVNAVQQQQRIIESLQQQNAELKARLAALELIVLQIKDQQAKRQKSSQ